MKLKTCLLTILIIFSTYVPSQSISTGVHFYSYEVEKELRTSLLLNEGKEIKLNNGGLILDFDVKFRNEVTCYGYIFRIINNEQTAFNLIVRIYPTQGLTLIMGDKVLLSTSADFMITYDEWMNVRFELDPSKDRASLTIGETVVECRDVFCELEKVKIIFGKSDEVGGKSSDIPPMSVRNISLREINGAPIAFWPLRDYQENVSFDTLHASPAKTVNAKWEIDSHRHWKEIESFKFPYVSQITYANEQCKFYIAGTDQMTVYDPHTKADSILPVLRGRPYNIESNHIMYNQFYDEIWSYNHLDNEISRFNFKTHTWSADDQNLKEAAFAQHNAFIYAHDSMLYTINGYGFYQYKNNIMRISPHTEEWQNVPSSSGEMPPRYMASAGFLSKDTLLIFGGFGHESGKQELGAYNYYDLYALSLPNMAFHKLWEIERPKKDYVVGNSMVVDTANHLFYTLSFLNDRDQSIARLRVFNIDTGENQLLADELPYTFYDVRSFCSLYLDEQHGMLYAVTSVNKSDSSFVNIYSLAYPPLSVVMPNETSSVVEGSMNWWSILLISTFSVSFILLVAYFIVQKMGQSRRQRRDTKSDAETISEISKVSSILFLGGFQVWDDSGKDITYQFSRLPKQLLILLMLHSRKNDKGISSSILNEILWSDKDDVSAQNNRRVAMSKLRSILGQVKGINVEKRIPYWKFTGATPFYNDYYEMLDLAERLRSGANVESEKIFRFMILAEKGALLPFTDYDWLDAFKSDYSNLMLDILSLIVTKKEFQDDPNLRVRVADFMVLHDTTDEYALRIKCRAFMQMGRVGLAKMAYESFCNEYLATIGKPYDKTLNSIFEERP